MREMLRLQARYNQFANNNMLAVLENLSPSELQKDVGVYYTSVLGTFCHILEGDIAILLGIINAYAPNPLDVKNLQDALASGLQDKSFESLSALRKEADRAIIELVDAIADFSEVKTLSFPGVSFEKPIAQYFLALLNHSIHHRGQIAAILDIMGVPNDFAGMLGM
ncbi:DinB family protein [uncultured Helicobacter sp.]|uniref:DinB family protein n=1 Tax=uncultured Helicobacter sp. TaxID=175537 RepID=UPI00375034E2